MPPRSILRNRRRAANAIEFALTLPAFLLILFGLIEFGGYFGGQAMIDSVVTIACREGAMLDPIEEDVPAAAIARMQSMIDTLPLIDCDGGCDVRARETGVVPGRSLVCQATVPYTGITGWSMSLPENIHGGSMMRYEWQRPPTPDID